MLFLLVISLLKLSSFLITVYIAHQQCNSYDKGLLRLISAKMEEQGKEKVSRKSERRRGGGVDFPEENEKTSKRAERRQQVLWFQYGVCCFGRIA